MPDFLIYLREYAVGELRRDISRNLDHYFDSYDWSGHFKGEQYYRRSKIEVNLDALQNVLSPDDETNYDAENSLTVYQALPISPDTANDERVWTYLTHFTLESYVKARWLSMETAEAVKAHYFAPTNRALIRDNGVSRLWWMGYLASKVAEKASLNAADVLGAWMFRSDVRASLLERPSSATSLDILAAITKLLVESFGDDQKLFERSVFRRFMRQINSRGGFILLDALEPSELADMFSQVAESAKMG